MTLLSGLLLMLFALAALSAFGFYVRKVRRERIRQRHEKRVSEVSREEVKTVLTPATIEVDDVLTTARKVRRDAQRIRGVLSNELDKLAGGNK